MAFELTEHAKIRCDERQIPEPVLERLQNGAFVAKALEDDGRVSNLHLVRVARDRYWVAIVRDEHVITVIHVGLEICTAREWFSRRLLNFRHVIGAIEAMPVTSTRRLGRAHDRELTGRKGDQVRDRWWGEESLSTNAASGTSWGIAA
ncbi:MAG: hypothetical protein WD273_02615 [Trueperaceae bacterium]